MFVNGMSEENFAATRDAIFSQGALSQTDSSMMTSQISAPKITDWNQGMGDGR